MHTGKIRLLIAVLLLLSCQNAEPQRMLPKINGVNFVAPRKPPVGDGWAKQLKAVHAGWIAVIPYAFSKENEPGVYYNNDAKWWGESTEGVITTIKQAKSNGLKVMLKPQVWMHGSWIGDFNLKTEGEWRIWENDYRKYLLTFARIADSTGAEALCIGTEYRTAAVKRPTFWKNLISEIRLFYKGELTYCANWDDYQQVSFWEDLDFIGMSGYFPLSNSVTPTVKELVKAWKPVKSQLKAFAQSAGKPVVFVEMGYRNIDNTAWRSWEMEYKQVKTNPLAQANAFEAFFTSVWNEPWFGGALIWKWYDYHERIGIENDDWTPQNKPAQQVIKKYFKPGGDVVDVGDAPKP